MGSEIAVHKIYTRRMMYVTGDPQKKESLAQTSQGSLKDHGHSSIDRDSEGRPIEMGGLFLQLRYCREEVM